MTLAQILVWLTDVNRAYLTGLLLTLGMLQVVHAASDTQVPNTGLAAADPLPKITALGIPNQALASLGDNHLIVVHYHPQRYQDSALPDSPIQIIQALTTVRASPERVMAQLLDFDSYAALMPHVLESSTEHRDGKQSLARFQLSFRLPLLHITPTVWMAYQQHDALNLSERLVRGDLRHSVGHWQLIPIDNTKTLVVQTSWSDIGSASWLLRLAFAAQPDFERLSPVSAAALTLLSVREAVSGDFRSPLVNRPGQTQPGAEQPAAQLADFSDAALATMAELAKVGNVSLIDPPRHLMLPGNTAAPPRWRTYQAVTTVGLIARPLQVVMPIYRHLPNYPRHIPAIKRIRRIQTDNHALSADWRLGFDFAIFTLNMNFHAKGNWHNDYSQFDFASTQGDFDFLYGRWRWVAVTERDTLVLFSSAHAISPTAPYLLRSIESIPFNQLFSGIFIGSQLIEGQQSMLNRLAAPPETP